MGVVATRELERSAFYRERVPRLCKQLGVFAFVCFAWIFFRADSLSDAWWIIRHLFGSSWADPQIPALMLAITLAIWGYQFLFESRLRRLLETGPVRVGLATGMILYMFLLSSGGGTFIYFQF